MANTAANVSTGKPNIAGAVYVGKIGTATAPSGTSVESDSNFTCLGYVSEDGLENANDMNVSAIKAWGGMYVLRSLTELNDEFNLTLIESKNVDVLKTVYGDDNVTVDSSTNKITVDVKAQDPEEMIWVFELELRGGDTKQIVIADGAITSRDAITYNDSDAIGYGITVSAYPDATGSTHKEYIL